MPLLLLSSSPLSKLSLVVAHKHSTHIHANEYICIIFFHYRYNSICCKRLSVFIHHSTTVQYTRTEFVYVSVYVSLSFGPPLSSMSKNVTQHWIHRRRNIMLYVSAEKRLCQQYILYFIQYKVYIFFGCEPNFPFSILHFSQYLCLSLFRFVQVFPRKKSPQT